MVTLGNAEVTPTEAAVLLGMSRPQVKVGTHHRICFSSIRASLEAERQRRREALADLAALQNELGPTE